MSKNEKHFNFKIPKFILEDDPLCSQSDPEMFFTQETFQGRFRYQYEKQAKAICKACPLLTPCLEYAIQNSDVQGIWGGTTEPERGRMRRGMRIPLKRR